MPGEPGRFDLSEIAKWHVTRQSKNRTHMNDALQEVDIRLKTIQADTKELELQRQRRELILASDVELWAATALIELRETFMSLSEVIAVSMPTDQKEFVRSEVDRCVRDALIAARRRLESQQSASIESDGES